MKLRRIKISIYGQKYSSKYFYWMGNIEKNECGIWRILRIRITKIEFEIFRFGILSIWKANLINKKIKLMIFNIIRGAKFEMLYVDGESL